MNATPVSAANMGPTSHTAQRVLGAARGNPAVGDEGDAERSANRRGPHRLHSLLDGVDVHVDEDERGAEGGAAEEVGGVEGGVGGVAEDERRGAHEALRPPPRSG